MLKGGRNVTRNVIAVYCVTIGISFVCLPTILGTYPITKLCDTAIKPSNSDTTVREDIYPIRFALTHSTARQEIAGTEPNGEVYCFCILSYIENPLVHDHDASSAMRRSKEPHSERRGQIPRFVLVS